MALKRSICAQQTFSNEPREHAYLGVKFSEDSRSARSLYKPIMFINKDNVEARDETLLKLHVTIIVAKIIASIKGLSGTEFAAQQERIHPIV